MAKAVALYSGTNTYGKSIEVAKDVNGAKQPIPCSCGAAARAIQHLSRGVWVIRCSHAECTALAQASTQAKCVAAWRQLQAAPYQRPDGIKPGDEVTLIRGRRGRGPESGPGFQRKLRARYISGDRFHVCCTLLEDDPDATVAPYKAGEDGYWHGASFIEPILAARKEGVL